MNNSEKIIYSLCDYSGEWVRPYRENGYTCRQIDLKNGDDVRLLHKPKEQVYGILAAPMCTVFANSGDKWYALRPVSEVLEGLSIVDAWLEILTGIWAILNLCLIPVILETLTLKRPACGDILHTP